MTALQWRMLELVLEIDAICQKHGITYYLAGGSVLGAVRHKGFIPWDDDIDIMMTRDNFAKFQQVCTDGAMADDREIITMINTPCHTKVTIKFMNKSTSQFFRSQVLDDTGCGISLDIMILDPLPRDEKQKEQHIAEYIVYNELLTPFFMVNEYLYKHVPLYNQYHEQAEREGKEQVMDYLYHRLFVDEPAESDQYLYRWGQQLLIYNRDLFGTPRYMDFEGYSLPVPERTLDFLRATYGDNWIYLPPQQQRETHVSNVNTNIAYCNWLKDIQPFLNKKKALSDFVNRKRLNVKNAVPAHELRVYGFQQNALLRKMEFETNEAYAYDVLATLDDQTLIQRLQPYLSTQLNSGYVKNGIYIQIPDPTLVLILGALIRTGEFVKADKILKLREANSGELSPALAQARQLIDDVRKFVRYFEDRRFDESRVPHMDTIAPALLDLCEQHPKQINLHRCKLQYYLAAKEATDEVVNAAECTIAQYPNDAEIAFWAGCLFEKMGLPEKAREQFAKSAGTSNGVMLQLLKEKTTEGTDNID